MNAKLNSDGCSGTQRSIVLTMLSCLFISLGVATILFAGVGINQLRTIGAADFRGNVADYSAVGFVWNRIDVAKPPAKPSEIAESVQNVFYGCGLFGIVIVAMGALTLGNSGSSARPDL